MNLRHIIVSVIIATLFMACTPEKEPIVFGKDHCAYCKMGIVDPKFGSEMVTEQGRVYKFDAVECMVPFMQENPDMEPALVLAIAFDDPENLYEVDQLYFEVDAKYQSPMGGHIAAFRRQDQRAAIPEDALTWDELQGRLLAN